MPLRFFGPNWIPKSDFCAVLVWVAASSVPSDFSLPELCTQLQKASDALLTLSILEQILHNNKRDVN
eukprot:g26081.t1